MSFLPRVLFLSAAIITMTGCSTIGRPFSQNGHSDYMTARSIQPLNMPPGVTPNGFQDSYPVSDRTYSQKDVNVSIVPPGLYNKQ
jgi:uncharacterized lipoprotein